MSTVPHSIDLTNPTHYSVSEWRHMIAQEGRFYPGMVFCAQDGESAVLNWLIKRLQARALRKMGFSKELVAKYRNFTHAGIIRDSIMLGHNQHRRGVHGVRWEDYTGRPLLIRKCKGHGAHEHMKARVQFELDLTEDYDLGDLLAFWLKWTVDFIPAFDTHELFSDSDNDVCSTSVVEWFRRALLITLPDKNKWHWFPAFLALDDEWFEDVEMIVVGGDE